MNGGAERAGQISRLMAVGLPGAASLSIEELTRAFGGNARQAWSFNARYEMDGHPRNLRCIMLSQVAGKHVEADVVQEFSILRRFNGLGLPVPQAVAVDPAGEIIGAPSIILEMLPGRTDAVALLRRTEPAVAREIIRHLAEVSARVHAVGVDPVSFDSGLAGLSARAIAEQQIEDWQKKFLRNRLEPMPAMAWLFRWLLRHLPEPGTISIIHGDLRPGNFLYEDSRVTGLLDWEMAHLGDPLEDICWIYRPFWSPKMHLDINAFVAEYSKTSGRDIDPRHLLYYRIFSELKFATISLTAARSFVTRATGNIRHADRITSIAPCLKRCFEWVRLHRGEAAHV